MMTAFLIPFISICIAEFLDKSQLTLLLLSSRVKHHFLLFLGAFIAFIIVDGSAILLGSLLTSLIPHVYLMIGAGILFLFFGIQTIKSDSDEKKTVDVKKTAFVSGFLAIFLSEWGDKTQLASAVFATQYHALYVFLGVMTALALLSLIAVYTGKFILQKFKRETVEKVAGITFVIIGGYLLFSAVTTLL